MINATTLDDVPSLKAEDIFDLEAAYVEWVDTEAHDDRRGHFHPSAVGMCARRGVYEYIKTPREFMHSTNEMEIFRMGHAIHALVQNILSDLERVLTPKGIKYRFIPEIPYDKNTDTLFLDFGIGGTCDGLLELEGPGWSQRGVVEIKTSKSELFNKLREPKPDHQMQANLYAFRFDTPIIYYWYYNKDCSERKVFTRTADTAVLDKAIQRFADQKAHVDAGTLPEREESFYMCPRCEYGHVCKPDTLQHIRNKQALIGVKKKGFGVR